MRMNMYIQDEYFWICEDMYITYLCLFFVPLCFGLLRLGWTSRIHSAAHLTSKAPGWLDWVTGQTGAVETCWKCSFSKFQRYIWYVHSPKGVVIVIIKNGSTCSTSWQVKCCFHCRLWHWFGQHYQQCIIWSPSRQHRNGEMRGREVAPALLAAGSEGAGALSFTELFILQTWLHVAYVMLSGWELVEIRSQECQYRPTFCWKVKAIGKHQRMSPTWWCNSSISNKFLQSCVLSKAVQALQSQRPSRGFAASVCATLSPYPRQGQRASCFWNALGGHLTFFPEPVVTASKPGISWIWSLQGRTSNGM